jgi:hypothetical protein
LRLISETWVHFGLWVFVLGSISKLIVARDHFVLNGSRFSTSLWSFLSLLLPLGLEHGHVCELSSVPVIKQSFELVILAFFLEDPVELAIIIEVVALHHGLEETSEVVVVGFLFEFYVAAVLDILHKFFR